MMGLVLEIVRQLGVHRVAAVGESVGGWMPRRWQNQKANSGLVRSEPGGTRLQRRREAAPRMEQARRRAAACGWWAAGSARRRLRRCLRVALVKSDWE